jgi:hypothetical protein
LKDILIDLVYSSVVSLHGVKQWNTSTHLHRRTHNDCECWVTNIENAYLESYTQEKVFIIAGAKFGELAGHTLIVLKALYRLKSSVLRWKERLTARTSRSSSIKAVPSVMFAPKRLIFTFTLLSIMFHRKLIK